MHAGGGGGRQWTKARRWPRRLMGYFGLGGGAEEVVRQKVRMERDSWGPTGEFTEPPSVLVNFHLGLQPAV